VTAGGGSAQSKFRGSYVPRVRRGPRENLRGPRGILNPARVLPASFRFISGTEGVATAVPRYGRFMLHAYVCNEIRRHADGEDARSIADYFLSERARIRRWRENASSTRPLKRIKIKRRSQLVRLSPSSRRGLAEMERGRFQHYGHPSVFLSRRTSRGSNGQESTSRSIFRVLARVTRNAQNRAKFNRRARPASGAISARPR